MYTLNDGRGLQECGLSGCGVLDEIGQFYNIQNTTSCFWFGGLTSGKLWDNGLAKHGLENWNLVKLMES